MNARITQIRKEAGLTQEEFAAKIGLSRNYVWMIEKGERTPSDRTISDICRIFDIQEDWLRHGLEPMRSNVSHDEVLTELVSRTLNGSSDLKKSVIRMLCSRSDDEIEVLDKMLRALYEEIKKD